MAGGNVSEKNRPLWRIRYDLSVLCSLGPLGFGGGKLRNVDGREGGVDYGI